MENRVCYVPILKAKQSESIALRHLDANIKQSMIPLFELQPRDTERLLNRTAGQIERSWEKKLPLFLDVDMEYLTSNQDEAITNLLHTFERAHSNGFQFIPVTSINRSSSYQKALLPVLHKSGRICFRLTDQDWLDLDELNNKLSSLLLKFNVKHDNADIILDYGAFLPSQLATIVQSAVAVVNGLKYVRDFRTLAFAATAFPANPNFSPKTVNPIPRTEWHAWLTIRKNKTLKRIPIFSDYTIVHPVFPELDFRFVKIAPKIKYTTKDNWLFIRGEKDNWPGFCDVCRLLVQQSEYSGPSFSWGDQHINQCANAVRDAGNPQRWVTIGVNHHLTLVSKLCANFP